MSWLFATLDVSTTGDTFPLIIPELSEKDAAEAVGFMVSINCPVGCHHHIALESTWQATLEVAACRLEMTPGHTGLLVASFFPPEHRKVYEDLKASADAHFRGRVN